MKELSIKPEIFSFDTCKEFCAEYKIGEGDLIITNEYIFNPYFTDLGYQGGCAVSGKSIGAGEPSGRNGGSNVCRHEGRL